MFFNNYTSKVLPFRFKELLKSPLLLAGVSGVLLSLTLPPFHQYLLAPFSFMLLAYVFFLERKGLLIRCSALFGFMFYLLHTYWYVNFHLMAFPMVLLVICFYFGAWGYLLQSIGVNTWTIAGSWMLLQLAIGSGYLAFPWSRIATAFAANPFLVQPVYVYGELLFGGIIVLFAASLSSMFYRPNYISFTVSLVLLTIGYGIGLERYYVTSLTPTEREVSLVQPNVISSFNPAANSRNLRDVLNRLTRSHDRRNRLYVWPESAISNYPFKIDSNTQELVSRYGSTAYQFSRLIPGKSRLLSGIQIHDPKKNQLNLLNAAVLLNTTGVPESYYTKRIMVPFGEHIPGMGRWKWVEKFGRAVGTLGYRSGSNGGLLSLGGGMDAGIQICYEDAFPKYVHNQVLNGADVLVNISNDSWSRSSASHWQHFYRARIRAIETGRTVLRNGTTGVSAIVDPLGRALDLLKPYEKGIVDGKIFKPLEKSSIVKYGSWYYWSGIVIFLVIGYFSESFEEIN